MAKSILGKTSEQEDAVVATSNMTLASLRPKMAFVGAALSVRTILAQIVLLSKLSVEKSVHIAHAKLRAQRTAVTVE